MTIGDKIRDMRKLKGLTQGNMAEMLDISELAYSEIERNKTNITLTRLEQIAGKMGVEITDIMTFGDKVSNFFDQSTNANSISNMGYQNNNNDRRELVFTIEKQRLEIDRLKAQKEKAEIEVRYWKEKVER